MKYRHKTTSEVIEVTESTAEGERPVGRGIMWLGVGDLLVKRASGEYEGYQPSHPFWADFEEVPETRVVRVVNGTGTRYHAERMTLKGWVRGQARLTATAAEQDVVDVDVEEVLVRGDEPSTPQIETSYWKRFINFIGLGN